ncbi:hypothetical protein AGMMS50276_28850 [Synergistales bacterium]|nr:hypothetical protein AGMMS50276_28850 [Synergistales bacterium]
MRRLATLFIFLLCAIQTPALAHSSAEWKARISENTVTIWVEGQDIGGIILNARAEINVTRLDRKMMDFLDRDKDVDEWVTDGLNYYYSNRKDIASRVKKKELFVVRCRANKFFEFEPGKLVINGHSLQKEDVLTNDIYWEKELAPDGEFAITVVAPPTARGQKFKVSYD